MATSSFSACDPPWPPDLCIVHRDTHLSAPPSTAPLLLHPEAPPPSVTSPNLQISATTLAQAPPPSPTPALWVTKLKSSSHNLKKMASPTFAADGTPVVQAPESVVLRSAQTWKGYLVAQFHGNPPSLTKVFNDLNPIWGKQGRIKIKHHSKGVYMIFIPCEVTRQWVLDVAFWHSGNCSFTVTEWSPNFVYTKMKLEFAPVWVLFRNIPPELWSLEGFSSFATGVGFPVQSEYPKLKPYSNGIIKLKVVIKLEGKKPKVVKVVDKLGNSVNIYAEYLKLPPKCGICSEFGHFDLRCPVASLRPVPQETVDKPPSQELDLGTSPAVSKSNSKANPPSSLRASLPALESNSKAGASGGALRRSISLPGSPVGSSKSLSKNGSSGWVRVGSKSPSKKSTSS
ncbi:hypothetical protein BRARA_K00932, partial [Brassica rapa]